MKWNDENIIFLISMPRSGSTLLQRILANQSEIASTSESWLLLPQLYALKENASFSEFSHTAASRAVNDFCTHLSGGNEEYFSIVKESIIENYRRVAGDDKKFYLEKTPRNNLILKEIVKMFPDSKFIFLWRNPVSVVASMIDSFASGKWNIYRQEIDLYAGYENMLASSNLVIKNRIDLKYEDLVSMPEQKTNELFSFIGLNSSSDVAGFVTTKLNGRMGDPTGIKEYSTISTQSLDKWKKTIASPLRKRWLVRYIRNINENDLNLVGYDKNMIIESIMSVKTGYRNLLSDAIRMFYGTLDRKFQITMIRRLHRINKGKRKYTLQ